MGGVRHSLSKPVARQCWPSQQPEPPLPSRTIVDPTKISKKEKAHLAKVENANGNHKPKPIQLKTISANLNNLPIPGITLGYTKESCAERVVGHEFMNTLPEGTHIGFNRRSGVVETNNAWIIFCNFGGNADRNFHMGRHSSDFSKGGRHLTFQVNPQRQNGKSSEKTLADYVLYKSDGKSILLFARDGTASKYTFCGSLRCIDYKVESSASVDLTFELLNYDDLVGDGRISSNFIDLVRRRQEMFEEMGVGK